MSRGGGVTLLPLLGFALDDARRLCSATKHRVRLAPDGSYSEIFYVVRYRSMLRLKISVGQSPISDSQFSRLKPDPYAAGELRRHRIGG